MLSARGPVRALIDETREKNERWKGSECTAINGSRYQIQSAHPQFSCCYNYSALEQATTIIHGTARFPVMEARLDRYICREMIANVGPGIAHAISL